MKLTGNLKKQVEKAGSKDEKKSLIENAGMLLNDDELDEVSGGFKEKNPINQKTWIAVKENTTRQRRW